MAPVAAAQRGFAMLELALIAIIAALLAVWGSQALVDRMDESHAQSQAVWMLSLRDGLDGYLQRHRLELMHATHPGDLAGAGFVDWQAPSIQELRLHGFVSPGLPERGAMAGAGLRILRTDDCPGNECSLHGLVYSDAGLHRGQPSEVDEGLMAQWLLSTRGYGGAVHPRRPDRIAGAAFQFPNPAWESHFLPPGTVVLAITAEQQYDKDFLRVRDTRNPDFQGEADIAMDLRGGQDVLAGRDVRAARDVMADQDVQAGRDVLAGNDVRADQDVLAGNDIRADQDVRAGRYLSPGAVVVRDSHCADVGAIARDASGGLLSCRLGRWRSAVRGVLGGFSLNTLWGCVSYTGTSTANPFTGACTCPAGSSMVQVSDSGVHPFPEGRYLGYLCVE